MFLKKKKIFKYKHIHIQRWLLKRPSKMNKKQSKVVCIFFNSFTFINYYLFFFSKILLKSFFLLNLYKFNNIKVTRNFLLNSNLFTTITKTRLAFPSLYVRPSVVIKKKKKKKKKKEIEIEIKKKNELKKKKKIKSYIFIKICKFFFWPLTNFFIDLYRKSNIIKPFYSYHLFIRDWFAIIHFKDSVTLNINNILIYMSEIFNSIKYAPKIYLNSLLNLYKKNKLLLQVLSFLLKFNKYKFFYLLLIKKKNIFYNNLKKIYMNYKKYYMNIYYKYLFNIIKIYNKYMATYNKHINKVYSKFSFLLKKKKNKKIKSIFLKKRFNFIFFLNNLINKFIYFIFLYWINLFLKILTFDNVYFFKQFNTILLVNQVYKLYYEKKRNKIMLKTRFLKYYKPCLFLLYLNNLKKNKIW